MSEQEIKNDPDIKKLDRLMEMSKTLYGIHKELESYEGTTTTLRQNILESCSGLDKLRNQIIGKTTGQEDPGLKIVPE